MSSASAAAAAAASASSTVSSKSEEEEVDAIVNNKERNNKRKADDTEETLEIDIHEYITYLLSGYCHAFMGYSLEKKKRILRAIARNQTKYVGDNTSLVKIGCMIMATNGAMRDIPELREIQRRDFQLGVFENFGCIWYLAICEHDPEIMAEYAKRLDDEGPIVGSMTPQRLAIMSRLASDGLCFTIPSIFRHRDNDGHLDAEILCAIMADDARRVAGMLFLDRISLPLQLHRSVMVVHDDTAAHVAARFGRLRVYEWLVKNGAKVDCKNSRGETPAELHAQNGGSRSIKAARKTD